MNRSLYQHLLPLFLLPASTTLPAQFWYLDIAAGELKCFREGGERFAESGLLAVGKGSSKELSEQLPQQKRNTGIVPSAKEETERTNL